MTTLASSVPAEVMTGVHLDRALRDLHVPTGPHAWWSEISSDSQQLKHVPVIRGCIVRGSPLDVVALSSQSVHAHLMATADDVDLWRRMPPVTRLSIVSEPPAGGSLLARLATSAHADDPAMGDALLAQLLAAGETHDHERQLTVMVNRLRRVGVHPDTAQKLRTTAWLQHHPDMQPPSHRIWERYLACAPHPTLPPKVLTRLLRKTSNPNPVLVRQGLQAGVGADRQAQEHIVEVRRWVPMEPGHLSGDEVEHIARIYAISPTVQRDPLADGTRLGQQLPADATDAIAARLVETPNRRARLLALGMAASTGHTEPILHRMTDGVVIGDPMREIMDRIAPPDMCTKPLAEVLVSTRVLSEVDNHLLHSPGMLPHVARRLDVPAGCGLLSRMAGKQGAESIPWIRLALQDADPSLQRRGFFAAAFAQDTSFATEVTAALKQSKDPESSTWAMAGLWSAAMQQGTVHPAQRALRDAASTIPPMDSGNELVERMADAVITNYRLYTSSDRKAFENVRTPGAAWVPAEHVGATLAWVASGGSRIRDRQAVIGSLTILQRYFVALSSPEDMPRIAAQQVKMAGRRPYAQHLALGCALLGGATIDGASYANIDNTESDLLHAAYLRATVSHDPQIQAGAMNFQASLAVHLGEPQGRAGVLARQVILEQAKTDDAATGS